MASPSQPDTPRRRPSLFMLFIRYGIPVIVIVGGIVAFAVKPSHTAAEGAGGVIGAGLAIWAANWFFRFGSRSDADRHVEAAARDYFSVHGEWPTDEERARFAREGRWREDQPLPGEEPAAVAGPTAADA